MSQLMWEEARQLDEHWELYFVHAEKTEKGWEFTDRSNTEVRYYPLPPEPDLEKVADLGLHGDRPTGWFDVADTLKERSQRNRRLINRVKVRFLQASGTG